MTLIRVKGGTENETAKKNKMHKSRRKIIDVLTGDDIKDTYGWTPEGDKNYKKIETSNKKDSGLSEYRMPLFCPRCKITMNKKLDKKFWYRSGHCFTCQQDMEHELRLNGVYRIWEKSKVFENEISILRELKEKFTEAYESVAPTSEIVGSTGHIEKFEFAGDWEQVRSDIKRDLDEVNELLPLAEQELENIKKEMREKNVEQIIKDFNSGTGNTK